LDEFVTVDVDGCGQKDEDAYACAARQLPLHLSPARGGKTGAQPPFHHAASRGKENQQLIARQLLKTKSEIVFGSCGNDDIHNRQLTNTTADKQLTPESGGESATLKSYACSVAEPEPFNFCGAGTRCGCNLNSSGLLKGIVSRD
jgi:hypothetical protein